MSGPWLTQRLWPALTELALAFAGLLAGFLATTLVVGGIKEVFGSTPIGLLGGPMITLVAVLVYGKLGQQAERARPGGAVVVAPPLEPAPLGTTVGVVALGFVAALLGSFAIGVLLQLAGMPVEEQAGVLDIAARARAGEAWGEAVMLVVAALLMAPVAEELLFRGLLWRRIRRIAGPGLAYGISAFGFAAIHANPAGLFIYAWLGVCFAAVLHRTGRVGAAIAVHMGNNAFVLASLFFG